MDAHEWTGIILAGGRSSRMGTDKALLELDGKPLLLRLAERMSALGLSDIVVSVGDEARERAYREHLADGAAGLRFVRDMYLGCGPLSGLHAALTEQALRAPGYAFVMACDMPVIAEPLLRRLQASVNRPETAARSDAGPDMAGVAGQPFHALYHTRVATRLRERLERGDYRVMRLLEELDAVYVEPLEGETEAFINLNDPDAYKAYKHLLQDGRSAE